uniref:Uncharacterized protein n=1 Tax=Leersia perrieri TaxID=77586 RepID=A0A0D9WW89_9ORYZ
MRYTDPGHLPKDPNFLLHTLYTNTSKTSLLRCAARSTTNPLDPSPIAASPADLYVEVVEDDDLRAGGGSRLPVAVLFTDGWELPPRPVLRNVFRRIPRNPDFDGVTFLCKPWLALAADGDKVVSD